MEFESYGCKEWTMDEMKGLNEYSKSLCINSASTNKQTTNPFHVSARADFVLDGVLNI